MSRKRLALKILLSFLCLLYFFSGCAFKQKNNFTLPPALSDPDEWDFGQVKEGKVLEHTFTLKNESPETLTINRVNTSCGCTASAVKKKVVLAGESTAIEVEFKSKGYSGPTQQYVYVHTDNLDKPIIKFTIKANIVK